MGDVMQKKGNEETRRYDDHRISLESTKENFKYSEFDEILDYKDFLYHKIKEVIPKYDLRSIYVAYMAQLNSESKDEQLDGNLFLETLTGFIVDFGIIDKNLSFRKAKRQIKQIPIILIDSMITDYHNLYYLLVTDDELEYFNDFQIKSDFAIRQKTHHVRGNGSGAQYLNYFIEIAGLFDKKNGCKDSSKSFLNIVKGFKDIFSFRQHLLSDTLMDFAKFRKIVNKTFNKLFNVKGRLLKSQFQLAINPYVYRGLIQIGQMFLYDSNEIREIFGVPTNSLRLQRLINQVGSGASRDYWVDNQIWHSPIIEVLDDLFLFPCFDIQLNFMEFIFLQMLDDKDKEKQMYHDIKSKEFFENKVEKVVTTKYKNIFSFSNFTWGNKTYETDLILKYKEFLVIIECKAGYFSRSRIQGRNTEKKVKEVMLNSFEQAENFKNIVESSKKIQLISGKKKYILNCSEVKQIITISVAFEWLLFLSLGDNNVRTMQMKNLGHIHLNLTELEDLVELLDSEEQFIYYLYKRRQLEKSDIKIFGDETDLIAYYLKNDFNFSKYMNPNKIFLLGEWFNGHVHHYMRQKYPIYTSKKVLEKFGLWDKPSLCQNEVFVNILTFINKRLNIDSVLLNGMFSGLSSDFNSFIKDKISETLDSNKDSELSFLIDEFSPKVTFLFTHLSNIQSQERPLIRSFLNDTDIMIIMDFELNIINVKLNLNFRRLL